MAEPSQQYLFNLRGLLGGLLVCEPREEQVYRWTRIDGRPTRHTGRDVQILRCATVETLRSLGNDLFIRCAYHPPISGPCPGRPGIVAHHDHPRFTERDLREIYLRHGLQLRVLLHRSKLPAPYYFRVLHSRYFPHEEFLRDGSAVISSMGQAFHSAIEDGELFGSGGGTPSGPGPITSESCPELKRHFHNGKDYKMELYARCFEWTHWGHILERFGESFLKISPSISFVSIEFLLVSCLHS